jgi:hypothetical protein
MESAHCCGRDEGGSVVPIEGGGELERGGTWEQGKRQRTTEETGGLYEVLETAAFTPTTTRLLKESSCLRGGELGFSKIYYEN